MSSGNAWGAERGWSEGAKSPAEHQPTAAAAFKAQETRDFLKQGISDMPYRYHQMELTCDFSTSGYNGDDVKAMRYKAPSVPATTKAGGPWGSKRTSLPFSTIT